MAHNEGPHLSATAMRRRNIDMRNLFDDREFAAGASASLNKTITAMMKFLEDDGDRPSRNFRTFLYKKICRHQ